MSRFGEESLDSGGLQREELVFFHVLEYLYVEDSHFTANEGGGALKCIDSSKCLLRGKLSLLPGSSFQEKISARDGEKIGHLFFVFPEKKREWEGARRWGCMKAENLVPAHPSV